MSDAELATYRVVVFFNTWRMSADDRRLVRERVAAGGRDVVFCYAPGYTDGRTNDDAFVREVTGLDLRRATVAGKVTVRSTASLGEPLEYSLTDAAIRPLYSVADPGATALGHFAGTEEVAIAEKSERDARHVVRRAAVVVGRSLRPRRPPNAGAPLLDDGDVVYAADALLTVHTKTGGRRTVTLRNGHRVDLDLPAGPSTVVLDGATGERVF